MDEPPPPPPPPPSHLKMNGNNSTWQGSARFAWINRRFVYANYELKLNQRYLPSFNIIILPMAALRDASEPEQGRLDGNQSHTSSSDRPI